MTPDPAPHVGDWRIEGWEGSAEALHEESVPAEPERAVWILEVDRPALVLGSTQDEQVVDHAVAEALGIEVVRRRSGGGAVLLVPGEVAWLDVIVPVGDPLWRDDVGQSSQWLGHVWQAALADLGLRDTATHTGPLACGPLGRLVCFCAVGPGEVTRGEQKVVGISQRRTRTAARFQCAVYVYWDQDLLGPLLRLTEAATAAVEDAAMGVGVPVDDIVAAFLRRLPV